MRDAILNETAKGFDDAVLVLIAHGSSTDLRAGETALRQAEALRRRGVFAEVTPLFWKQTPPVAERIAALTQRRIFVVPLLSSDGYFADQVIPRALGLRSATGADFPRQRGNVSQTLIYCHPVGTHPQIARLIAALARETLASRPFPRAPLPGETALFIAGHGTEKNARSRLAVEGHVQTIRAQGEFGEVHAVYLEESPFVQDCFAMTRLKSLVVVPSFIGEGPHVAEDLPVCLGEPRERVRARLATGQSGWPNPTEKNGKRVWLSASVGGHPGIVDIILARAMELASA